MKEAIHQTITRRSDEPKLQIGDSIPIKDGKVGVVLARYNPSGDVLNEVRYIVELKPDEAKKGNRRVR